MDLHLARQLVLSLEFSTQHRRIEKLEGQMGELINQKESLQSDYEALQSTNEMLKDMVEEAKRGRALQVQETIRTEMRTGDAVAETDKVELEAEKAKLWEEAADTFADGFDLALEQVKCVFPEADYSQFAMDFEVVDGKIVRP